MTDYKCVFCDTVVVQSTQPFDQVALNIFAYHVQGKHNDA
jgi:hypothetical protein